MKTFNHIKIGTRLLFLILFILALNGNAQTERTNYTIGLANVTQTANTLEMDVTFTIDSATKITKLSQISVGINYDTTILNNGLPCSDKNCGSWTYIGGKSNTLTGLETTVNSTMLPYGNLRIIGTPVNRNVAINIGKGTYILGRYRFTNTTPWTKNSNARLWIQPNNENNTTNSIVSVYSEESNSKLIAISTTNSKDNKYLTLEYTSETPLNYILNSKEAQLNDFKAIATPNPYSDSFRLELKTAYENSIQVKVYNMLGQLIEQKNIEVSEIESLQLGSNYQSGIYNINVTQGKNSDTLRIIKR